VTGGRRAGRLCLGATTVAVGVLVALSAAALSAGAVATPRAVLVDTTTTTVPVTPTTVPATTTTVAPTTTTVPVTTTTVPPTTTTSSSTTTTTKPATITTKPTATSSTTTPWALIGLVVVLVIAIVVVILLMVSRRRKSAVASWRRRALPALSDAKLAREALLSPSAVADDAELRGAVAVQVERASTALEAVGTSAPDPAAGGAATTAAGALRGLAFAIEADRLLRHGAGAPTGVQLAQADQARRDRDAELQGALVRLQALVVLPTGRG
jgi:hypothetical protein